MVEAPTPSPAGTVPAPPSSSFASIAAAGGAGLLYLDAAIETFSAGSVVRWWAVLAAAIYAAVTALTWRRQLSWQNRLTIAAVGLVGLVAATAWAPGGLTDGIRIAGQPTARVVSMLAALGVGLAGLALLRTTGLPVAARVGIGLVAVYGAGAYVAGAVAGADLSPMLGGRSFWQPLPRVLQGAFVGGLVVLPLGLVWAVVRAGLRRPREATWRGELWKLCAMTASLATVLAGLPVRSGGATSAPPPAEDSGQQARHRPVGAETLGRRARNGPHQQPARHRRRRAGHAARPLGPGVRGHRSRPGSPAGVRMGSGEHDLDSLPGPPARPGRRADGPPGKQPRSGAAAGNVAAAARAGAYGWPTGRCPRPRYGTS